MIDDFLNKFNMIPLSDLEKGVVLNFEIEKGDRTHKITPILQQAKIKHATAICNIFKNAYHGLYPFKRMEDPIEIKQMIKNPQYLWLIFKTNEKEVIGCLGAHLDKEYKKGYLFGFAIKPAYQGKFDSLKAFIGSLIIIWKTYESQILIWSSEVRTYDTAPQYGNIKVGLEPIAFLPNKDIFTNHRESEFFTITYNKEVFKRRCKKKVRIIKEVINCYLFSKKRYDLKEHSIEDPIINLNKEKCSNLGKELISREETDKYGNKAINYYFKKSQSKFSFIYNSISRNIEKIKYKIENLEELIVFIRNLKNFMEKYEIVYAECYVSAYKPRHQKIFYNANFKPTGYIPGFHYNKNTHEFQDIILFALYKGIIDPDLKYSLIPETKELYKTVTMGI